MYRIPLLDSYILVDCRWKSYDPDRFDIDSIEWEIGITIPKSVWWNLMITTPESDTEYIHEYIFGWLCANEPIEYDSYF